MKLSHVFQNRDPVTQSSDHTVGFHIGRRISLRGDSVSNTGFLRGVSSRSACYTREVRYRRFTLVTRP